MKFSTKIKLYFNKNLRNKLSCVGCELPCYGKHIIKKDIICDIQINNYENIKNRMGKR